MSVEIGDGPLLIATHNAGKLEEMRVLLAGLGRELVSAGLLGLPEPDETGTTFVENGRIKAHDAAQASGFVTLADDSGIEIDALDGAPGVYTADWAETDHGRDFGLAMARAHDAILATGAPKPWPARFCCTLVLAWPNGADRVYRGVMEGRFVWPRRGNNGHGYDPVFQPHGHDVTFAEMETAYKNQISHRAAAIRLLLDDLGG